MAWFQKAGDNSELSNAHNSIGYMYHHGQGVEINYDLVLQFYISLPARVINEVLSILRN